MIPPKLIKALRNAYWRIVPVFLRRKMFDGSGDYWEKRYACGGTSGPGSYGKFATFKADTLNRFVKDNSIWNIIEFGCGDGNQLTLANYPDYLGVDVSQAAIEICRKRFEKDATKHFLTLDEYDGHTASLALSLDVIYHLVEDEVFDTYMRRLFASAERYVIIYSSDTDDNADIQGPHIRHRRFSDWVQANATEWHRIRIVENPYPYEGDGTHGSFADFHFYQRG